MKIESDAPQIRVRYNFTYNFLVGAATLARLAHEIDEKGKNVSELEQLQYKAFVSGCIMQSVASLESEAWSILNHGLEHHSGSNGLNQDTKALLSIVAKSIEKEQILVRYDLILQLIKGKRMDMGKYPMQDLTLLINLRNEITHFKSLWTDELDRKNLFKELERRDCTRPLFYPEGSMNFFPNICLNTYRAKWAVDTVVAFIDYFFNEMGVKSPLQIFNRKLIYF